MTCTLCLQAAWGIKECTVGEKRVHMGLCAYDTRLETTLECRMRYGEVRRAKGSMPEV